LVDTNSLTSTTVPGWRTLTNVWVSYFTSGATPSMTEARKGYLDADFGDGSRQGRIGPEYGFGLAVGSQLGDPVLIIKTAWGGTSLVSAQANMWTPPSSGGTVGNCYTTMVAIVTNTLAHLNTEFTNFNYNATNGYEIAGFAWHQGWNDIGVSQASYETNLVNLIHDIRAEFGVPRLPVAIGITGMASASGNQLLICAAQAAVANPVLHPELAGTVFTVDTRPFDYGLLLGVNDQGYHWYFNGQSQFNIGQSMGLGMLLLLASPPAVTNAPATGTTSNAATLHATALWPATAAQGLVYWNTVNGGTNAALWTNVAPAGAWTNTATTNQYGVPGDTVLAGGLVANITATNLSCPVTGLTPATTYYFTFRATNTAADVWATNVLTFTTAAAPAATPTGLAAVGTNQQVNLTWNAVTNAAGYRVKRSPASNDVYAAIGAPPAASYADAPLTNGVVYWYVVAASNGAGVSADSTPASARPLPPTAPAPTLIANDAAGSGFAVNSGQGSALQVDAMGGIRYRLRYADDLLLSATNWPWVTPPSDGWVSAATNGPLQLSDPAATNRPQRFYRLEAQKP